MYRFAFLLLVVFASSALANEETNHKVKIRSYYLPDAAGPGLGKPVTASIWVEVRGTDNLDANSSSTPHKFFLIAESTYTPFTSGTAAGVATNFIEITSSGLYSLATTFTVPGELAQGVYRVLTRAWVYRVPDGKVVGLDSKSGLTGIVTQLHLGATVATASGATLFVSSSTDPTIIEPNAVRAGVQIPPGAVTEPILVTVDLDPFLTYSNLSAGPALVLSPDNYSFQIPVTITVPYNASAFESTGTLEADAGMVVWEVGEEVVSRRVEVA